ncbi:MAG: hypothetical protein GYA17_03915, partial [Chloroflexi bacterium]|nr:hypothetical protein [Chloroflexota bacterium]
LNNVSDLKRAILILLRADLAAERLMGTQRISVRTIGFYELVMLLNKSEPAVLKALDMLHTLGLVEANLKFEPGGRVSHIFSSLEITPQGMIFLEKGDTAVTFNHIHIVNSNVGIVSLQSTLTNIDVRLGNIKQQGHTDLAGALSTLTEQVTHSTLAEGHKQELLEQVELLGEQAEKGPQERKMAIVKGALAFLEKALETAANLATIWSIQGPIIKTFFGI